MNFPHGHLVLNFIIKIRCHSLKSVPYGAFCRNSSHVCEAGKHHILNFKANLVINYKTFISKRNL